VVLFQNTSTDLDDAFLGPALGIRTIDDLFGDGSLSIVASRRFGFEAVASPAGAEVVGRMLGVPYVLAARVGRSETGEVTLSARLRRSSDGAVIWNLTRSVTVQELPALTAEISDSVVDRIASPPPRAAPATARLAAWSGTPDGTTVDHFLRGTYYSSLNSLRGYEAALAQFDSASRSDPEFAPGFANSALTIAAMLEWGWWDYGEKRVHDLTERGLAAADRAIALDSTLASAWVARGALLSFSNPETFAGSFDAYTRAMAYAPGDPLVHHWYGRALMQVGDEVAARRELSWALRLAPGDAEILLELARLERREGRGNEACAFLDSAIAVDPTAAQAYIVRAMTRAQRGGLRFAWADAEIGGRLGWPFWGQAASAVIYARARDTLSARERAESLRGAVAAAAGRPSEWAGELLPAALVASGEPERALDLLEHARYGGARLWFAMGYPEFAPLRKSPRYRRLLAASQPRR
jgi:tetratricopeptide (TPR) repeat protein/TolB-like protein